MAKEISSASALELIREGHVKSLTNVLVIPV